MLGQGATGLERLGCCSNPNRPVRPEVDAMLTLQMPDRSSDIGRRYGRVAFQNLADQLIWGNWFIGLCELRRY